MARRNRAPLTAAQRRQRVVIAAIAAVLIVAIAVTGLVVGWLTRPAEPGPIVATPGATNPPSGPAEVTPGDVVDPTVTALGWLPQPVTDDPRAYGEAAAAALATYDTTLATRADLIDYLATWHTIDTRFASEKDRNDDLESSIRVVGRSMIPSVSGWDEQALVKTILTATVVGSKMDKELLGSGDETAADQFIAEGQHIVTTDIVVTTSEEDRSTGERVPYDQRFTITVRLMCGNSVPPVGSGQSASSCMILNYLNEPRL